MLTNVIQSAWSRDVAPGEGDMKVKATAILCAAALLLSCSRTPRGGGGALGNDPTSPAPLLVPDSSFGDVKQMTSGCWTNDKSCAGYATVGDYGFAVKCSIWWNNGANGRLNMRFKAGESYDFYLRYNDMCVCVPSEYPLTERRFYCWVR